MKVETFSFPPFLVLFLVLSALLDEFVDRHEGLLKAKSLQSAASLNLPQPVGVTGQIQLVGDLWWAGRRKRMEREMGEDDGEKRRKQFHLVVVQV